MPMSCFFCYPKADWPLSVGQLAAAMAERRDSTVVLLEGRIAGFANFYQWHYDDHCALGNLMIAPWARGQGVAQYLVAVMEQLARAHYRATRMQVSCFNANSAGQGRGNGPGAGLPITRRVPAGAISPTW
jgi:RimJ/RimL family protein N-acetyltransferase